MDILKLSKEIILKVDLDHCTHSGFRSLMMIGNIKLYFQFQIYFPICLVNFIFFLFFLSIYTFFRLFKKKKTTKGFDKVVKVTPE